jgi:hypothetical protein
MTPAVVPVVAPAPRFDFPTWLPPMLVKELRQGLRTRGFVGSLVGFQAVMVIAYFFACFTQANDRGAFDTANSIFWTITGLMLVGSMPLRGLAGLNTEIEARTIDLLVLTRLTAWRIVTGKWVSLMAQALLLTLALLPYAVMRYYLGPVDLLNDLAILGWLFASSALLTAFGLWASSWGKHVRGLLVALTIPGVPLGIELLNVVFRYGFAGGSGLPGLGSVLKAAPLVLFDGGVLLAFCLLQAVRRLAPPADNHAWSTRGLALLPLIPVPVLAMLGWTDLATGQAALSAVGLLVVAALELARGGEVMLSHVRPWFGRGVARAAVGRSLLPGWPGAARFAVVAVLLACGVFLLNSALRHRADLAVIFVYALWLAPLAWMALVFPAALLSYVPRLSRNPGAYWMVQGVIGLLTAVAMSEVTQPFSPALDVGLDFVSSIFPVSSFWHALSVAGHGGSPEPLGLAGQAAMLLAVLALVWRRSRAYWVNVRALVTRCEAPSEL